MILRMNQFNGTYTNFLDTFNNLKSFTNYDINFYLIYEDRKVIKRYKKYLNNKYNFFYIPNTLKKYSFENDVCIFDKNILYDIYNDNIKISSKNSILLFPSFLVDNEDNKMTILRKVLKENNIITFCNIYNSAFIDNFIIWRMKLSKERMNNIKSNFLSNDNSKLTSLNYNESKNKNIDINPFSYNIYEYERRQIYYNKYYENIGKLIFEFLYFKKQVFYSSNNKQFDDGLTENLNMFNINDRFSQILKISKNDIEKKLFMKKSDKLLHYLKEIENENIK